MTGELREMIRDLLTQGFEQHRGGDRAGAAMSYVQAISLLPSSSDAWHLLGIAALECGRDAAVRALLLATALTPGSGVLYTSLAHGLFGTRQPGRALPVAMAARRLAPNHIEARMAEGLAAMALGKAIQASAAFRAVIDAQPGNLAARTNLAVALQALGKVTQALSLARETLSQQPDQAAALAAAASGHILLGQAREAIALYEAAEATSPEAPSVGSNILFTMAYDETQDSASVAEAASAWGKRYASPIHAGRPDLNPPGGPLKVGYLSQDFRDHPVGRNTLPVIAAHDPKQVTAFLYALRPQDDIWTTQAMSAGTFRACEGLTDRQVAQIIQADGLDVLVILAGHTAHGQPLVAAHQPAPLQVWWHDLQPSGLDAVAYRVSDPILTGLGDMREAETEAPVLLPVFYCHEVPQDDVPLGPPPMLRTGHPVLGSLNNPAKLSDACLGLWRRVMEAIPDAQLMVKYKRFFQDPGIIARMKTALGPAADRLVVLAADDDRLRHLDVWNRIDVALDPFPFNGSTTTFEALWMGVPVVTLRGDRFTARVGASVMSALGHPEWVAETEEDYVKRVCTLVSEPDTLAGTRAGLRRRLQTSSLMNAAQHARWLEASYSEMIRRHRDGLPQADIDVAELLAGGEGNADR